MTIYSKMNEIILKCLLILQIVKSSNHNLQKKTFFYSDFPVYLPYSDSDNPLQHNGPITWLMSAILHPIAVTTN